LTTATPPTHRLGDSRFYYVTTAAAELGVVFARSAEGHTMQPVSSEEVQCPVTKTREWRRRLKTAELTAAHAAAHRSRGPPARRGLPPGPEGGAFAAWVQQEGCGGAPVPAQSRRSHCCLAYRWRKVAKPEVTPDAVAQPSGGL